MPINFRNLLVLHINSYVFVKRNWQNKNWSYFLYNLAMFWEFGSKVSLASSSGSLGFIVCVLSVVGWLIVYQDSSYLYCGQYIEIIFGSQIGWYFLQGGNILIARPSSFLESRSWWGTGWWGRFKWKIMCIQNPFKIHFYYRNEVLWCPSEHFLQRVL